MNSTNTKKSSAGRKKAFLSIFLMVALLLTGAFAFLTSTDSKINVFTVGKVDIELIEKFDTDLSGEIEDDETYDASNTVVAIEGGKEIMPGQKIIKQPSIKNTGKNSAYVYMAVGLPVADLADVYAATDDGSIDISGKKVDIKLRAYAIQENYKQAGNANEAWESYFKPSSLGTEADQSDSSFKNRVQLFKTYPSSGTDSGTNNEWQYMDTYYTTFETADEGSGFADLAYNWYIYKYDEMLGPDETTESALFDTVALVGEIGEAMPVSVSYYAPQSVISKANEVSTMALDVVSNIPEDFVLVNQEYYTPGDALTLYVDDSLAQTGYRYDWVLADDISTCAYTGMTVEEDTQLLTTYQDLVNASGSSANDDVVVPDTKYEGSSFLCYSITKEDGEWVATVIGADATHKDYPKQPSDVVIPTTITVIGHSATGPILDNGVSLHSVYYNVPIGQIVKVTKLSLATGRWDTETITKEAPEAIAFASIAKTIAIPDSIKSIGLNGHVYSDLIPSGIPLQKVNISAASSLEDCAFSHCVNLADVILPNTITKIPVGAFSGCDSFNEYFTIPDSVQIIEKGAFHNDGLKYLTLGSNVSRIDQMAFSENLKDFNIKDLAAFCDIRVDQSYHDDSYDKEIPTSLSLNGEQIKVLTIPDGVSYIRSNVFEWFGGIEEIVLPDSVLSIGEQTFDHLSDLKTLRMGNNLQVIGIEAFACCYRLSNITWSNHLKYLHRGAFYSCHNLSGDLNFPEVVSVGDYALAGNFNEIKFGKKLSSLSTLAFDGAYINYIIVSSENETYASKDGILYSKDFSKLLIYPSGNTTEELILPEGLITLEDNALSSNYHIEKISIPSTVTDIGDWVLNHNCIQSITVHPDNKTYDSRDNCNAIVETATNTLIEGCNNTVIPDSVKNIGDSAFRNCYNLTNVTIPDSVTSIGEHAFSDCTGLTSISIPDGVTSIGNSAFSGCSELTSITMSDNVISIGFEAFVNSGYYNDESNWENDVLYIGNHLIETKSTISGTYEIREGTKTITPWTFNGCNNLTDIIIPDSVVYIGDNAFSVCERLSNITMSNNVSYIGGGAFSATGYYNDESNWENGILYIGSYCIKGRYVWPDGDYLTIKDGTTLVASGAINSSDIAGVTIPNSVKTINKSAVSNLSAVTYQGTLAEWSKVNCPFGSLPSGITIYCTDGTTTQ